MFLSRGRNKERVSPLPLVALAYLIRTHAQFSISLCSLIKVGSSLPVIVLFHSVDPSIFHSHRSPSVELRPCSALSWLKFHL